MNSDSLSRAPKVESVVAIDHFANRKRSDYVEHAGVTTQLNHTQIHMRSTSPEEDMITVVVRDSSLQHSPSTLDLTSRGPKSTHEPGLQEEMSSEALLTDAGVSAVGYTTGPLHKRRRRTRRGCLTCRRRKKKCDEVRPTCQNCRKLQLDCQLPTATRSTLTKLAPRSDPARSRHFALDKTCSQENSDDQPHQPSDSEGVHNQTASHEAAVNTSHSIDNTYHSGVCTESITQQTSETCPVQTQIPVQANCPPGRCDLPAAFGHQGQELLQSYCARDPLKNDKTTVALPHSPRPQPTSPRHIVQVPQANAIPQNQRTSPPHRIPVQQLLSQEPPQISLPLPVVPKSPGPHLRSSNLDPQPSLQSVRPRYVPMEPSNRDLPAPQAESQTHRSANQQIWPYQQININREYTSGLYRPATFSAAKTFALEDVARSQMLRNAPYRHLDATLVRDRQRCDRALERFRKASAMDSGLEGEAVRKLLWQIFDPRQDITYHCSGNMSERGNLSDHVNIERDFSCSYGYNITLCTGVYIDSQVFIDDAARVYIGAGSWIGHGVKVLTSVPYPEPGRPLMEKRVSRPVRIEADVIVGQGALIYPGVTLTRGSVVEPGSVIKQDYTLPNSGH